MKKLLLRSKKDKVLGGVCAGVAEYLDIDPTVIRFLWVLVTIFTGFVFGILAYIVSLFIIPKTPKK